MLDSLACTDGAIGATAQGWLVRALSLGDVARILEPVLLLLLEPKTQRASIHCLKQQSSTGEHAARRAQARPALCPWGREGWTPAAWCSSEALRPPWWFCHIQKV